MLFRSINDDGGIAKRIIEFSNTVDEGVHAWISSRLMRDLTQYMKANDIGKADKIFHFIQANPVLQPIHWNFYNIITGIKGSHSTQHLINTLNFANKHGMSDAIFKENLHTGENLFQFAKRHGVEAKVEEAIINSGSDIDQWKQLALHANDNGGLFAGHRGKIAIVASSLIVSAAVFFALEWPIIGVVAIAVSIVAAGILGKEIHSEYKTQNSNDKSITKAIGSVLSDMVTKCVKSQKAV